MYTWNINKIHIDMIGMIRYNNSDYYNYVQDMKQWTDYWKDQDPENYELNLNIIEFS